jgi:hypothetical protein
MEKSEKEKLQILLKYWIDHNKEHGDEFLMWADKSKELGEMKIEEGLIAAAEYMTKANDFLREALSQLEPGK